jgi:predicted enzyme involved in methoxymalonyl-ACP biosynthesis
MDYSKIVKASEEADFAYARWYAQLPKERKAELFLSAYSMVVEKIRNDVLQHNPFATEAEIRLEFIRHTQKEDYPPETFRFIEQEMQKKIEAEWKSRFKNMKRKLDWSYEDMARYMGAQNGNALKASISRKVPNFAKLAICLFEKLEK